MPRPAEKTNEWTLWVVAAACPLHGTEEFFTGWQDWAREALGIVIPAGRFLAANALLILAALLLARLGWRRPVLSLLIPSLTLVNAVIFHILPTIVESRVSPGVYTATLLYLPFSSWALVGAARDGVPRKAIATAFVAGALLMVAIFLGARSLSDAS